MQISFFGSHKKGFEKYATPNSNRTHRDVSTGQKGGYNNGHSQHADALPPDAVADASAQQAAGQEPNHDHCAQESVLPTGLAHLEDKIH